MEAARWGGFFSSVQCQGGHRLGLAPKFNDPRERLVDVVLGDERLVIEFGEAFAQLGALLGVLSAVLLDSAVEQAAQLRGVLLRHRQGVVLEHLYSLTEHVAQFGGYPPFSRRGIEAVPDSRPYPFGRLSRIVASFLPVE